MQDVLLSNDLSQLKFTRYKLGCPPAQDASHHQDDLMTFLRLGDRTISRKKHNDRHDCILGGGTTQLIH